LDRDLNASKNILKEGIKISSGTDDYRCGDEIRPEGLDRKAQSVKHPKRRSLSPETYRSLADK
jgi:hypothetical protein